MVTEELAVHPNSLVASTLKVYVPAAVGVNTGLATFALLRPADGYHT